MELRQLRYFLAVAEELHFGRAAVRLGISQPPLSQQIRALEQELGLDLLARTSRRVELTEAGRLFLVEARKTLEQADRTARVASRALSGEVGELAIGFTTSTPFVPQVTRALFRFRTDFPDVHLRLEEMSRDGQLEALAEKRLDLGFIRGVLAPKPLDGLDASLFLEEPLLLAMHEGHKLAASKAPIRIADLHDEDFVFYHAALGAGFIEPFFQLCGNAGFRPRIVQEASGPASLLGLLAAGFGVTVMSRSFGALHLDHVVHRPLADRDAISRLWLIRQRAASPASELFIRQLGTA